MQIVYARKPKIHMLRKGKAVCGRHWLDGEEEGSKFSNLVDCKDCLRLLTQRAPDVWDSPRQQTFSTPEALILAYQLRTGERIDAVALVTMVAVERIIAEWYSAEEAFPKLITDLKRYFGDTRVDTLSRTLVGDLHAQMIIQQMQSYGLTEWYWDHKGEDVPCTNPITMLGKTYAGCKELNGKVFRLGDPMPPDAAHPNCHCLPTPEGL